MDFLDFFKIFLVFHFYVFGIFLNFLGFLDLFKFFRFLWIFFGIFLLFFSVPFKVTKVTTKCYHGYNWTPKIAKNGPKQHKELFFCQKGKKSLGQSPPQELEVGPRSGPYLLVHIK